MDGVDQLVARCRSLSARVGTFLRRTVAETDALGNDVQSLLHTIKETQKECSQSDMSPDRAKLETAKAVLYGNGPGGDLRKFCHKKNPFLIRCMLGSKANVVTYRHEDSLALKEEYHEFRDKSAMIVLLFPLILIWGMRRAEQKIEGHEAYSLAPAVMFGVQLFLIWLVYMYLALALRENVLVVNGSNIRSWWITHHYLSIVACMIMLSLPLDSPAVNMFCVRFLGWTVFQGVVMLVQNRYQRRRMYTRIALGKNSVMDVVTGESSGAKGQLALLYPLLFALQCGQIMVGTEVIYKTAASLLEPSGWFDPEIGDMDLRGQRGVFVAGLVFGAMGVLNFTHTIATIRDKRSHRKERKPNKQK